MNRQQLQAKIKELKAQGLVSKKFDARQSNKILAEKIAEVTNDEADRDELKESLKIVEAITEQAKADYVPVYTKATIKKVLKWTGNFQGKALDEAVKLTMEAGNKYFTDRTAVDNVIVAAFIRYASNYNQVTA